MKSTPKLEVLEFDVVTRIFETDNGRDLILSPPFCANTLGAALNQVRSNLERLVVGSSTHRDDDSDGRLSDNDFIVGEVGAMKEFRKLKYVVVSILQCYY